MKEPLRRQRENWNNDYTIMWKEKMFTPPKETK